MEKSAEAKSKCTKRKNGRKQKRGEGYEKKRGRAVNSSQVPAETTYTFVNHSIPSLDTSGTTGVGQSLWGNEARQGETNGD